MKNACMQRDDLMRENPWLAKARELDQYRWLLLRERHGVLGSALRFAREAMGDWWFGMRARWRLARDITAEPCDFLLLQSAPKVIAFRRKRLLIDALRARGYTLVETALQEPGAILRGRMLKRPPCAVPSRYFGLAAYAEWIVECYRPRVLLNDRNGSLYSPFLRLALNTRGLVLVHLAHATTVERSRRLSMNDYDYNFLFGQSSLEALQGRALRFGRSTAVLAGSHMIDSTYDLPVADPNGRTLLILGVGPDKEKEAGYQTTYRLLRDWAALHPEYQVLVKAHPRSEVPFWQQAAAALDNLEVLPRECSLAEALGQATVAVNIMSNAVIEAALARRPIIYVNAGEDVDVFSQERFLGRRVSSLEDFSARMAEVAAFHGASVARSASLAEYHLAHGCEGLAHCLSLLQVLQAGGEINGVALPGHSQVGHHSAGRECCFERAYVINLDHRHDRWLQTLSTLQRVGIAAERFSAVDFSALAASNDSPSAELDAFLKRVDGVRPSNEHKLRATWACMRSHLAIIRMAKEQGLSSVLILEDDCEFEPYSRAVLARAERQLQTRSWQMLYLGGTLKKGGQRTGVSKNLMQVSRVRLAHAYVVRAALYDRILAEAPASGLPLDWYYSECLLPSVEAYMVKPILANQRLFDMSDIEQVERHPKFKTRQAIRRCLAKIRYGRN
ncbi:Glycosyltransferase family 25 (LPS biosynthesis protein) [Pseudomonas cuatrocienegasensis]|uniref:Glycosyltransferase family 25 (LPS biosynthesis protein) n=2 Tax=Pseudomonas TaxID=286 RepID=A0ABY1BH10_9PSED|nr:Glycosyltransferase family 25 (LPS biosynthesis protein) [Pseudomonas cuatrocienegasensis]